VEKAVKWNYLNGFYKFGAYNSKGVLREGAKSAGVKFGNLHERISTIISELILEW